MAFMKYAKANLVQPAFHMEGWDKIRVSSTQGRISNNLIEQASEIFQTPFNPNDYLLSHVTIVASVDTFAPANVKLGNVTDRGANINRKYADFRITPETQSWINNNCFVPGTLITMFDGTVKPIEDVRVGDFVLSHKGIPRKVTKLYKNPHQGELFEVGSRGRGSNENLFTTSEHPFYVYQANRFCVNCGAETPRSMNTISSLLGKFYCGASCYREKKATKADLLSQKEATFVEAKDLWEHDFLTSPVPMGQESVDLTMGQARLLGLFLAEGYYELDSRNNNSRKGVCWAFHENESNTLAKDVIHLLKEEFGVEGVVREHSLDRGIHVTSKWDADLVSFFETWILGDDSKSKHLHANLMIANPQIQMEVVRGWFEGDGSLVCTDNDVRLSGASANPSLVNQIQLILFRLGVSSRIYKSVTEGRRRLIVDGVQRVVSDPSKETTAWQLSCGGSWISDLVENTVYEKPYEEEMARRGDLQNPPSLRFLNGYHVQKITTLKKIDYSGYVYNLEVEEDHSYIANGVAVHNCDAWSRDVILKSYRTFIGAQNFQEHVQIEELSKGRIIDAVARDIGPSIYVDILVATDLKHRDLVAAIKSGNMSTLSMGCSIDFSLCTKCGHVMADETEMCRCVKYEKGNTFYTEDGQRQKIAELCGHADWGDTGGVIFIEGSWVATPAFAGAVLRNVLSAKEVTPEMMKQAQAILSQPPEQWINPDSPIKKAFLTDDRMSFDFDLGDAGSGDSGDDQEEPKEEKNDQSFKDVEDDLYKHLKKRIKKRLRDEMDKEEQGKELTPEDSTASPNDTLIKQARIYRSGITALLKTANNDADFINRVARYNRATGIHINLDVYRAALKLGSSNQYKSFPDFLEAVEGSLGRKPNNSEIRTLVRLAKLLSSLEANRS